MKVIFTTLSALLLCSSCVTSAPEVPPSSGASPSKSNGTTLLGYYIPPIPNWAGTTFTKPGSMVSSVTYKSQYGNTKAILKFSVISPASGSVPDDLAKLNKVEDESLQIMKKMDATTEVLRRENTTFKGHPAVLTSILRKNSQSTVIRVADGKNTLSLSKSFVGLPVSQKSQQETEVAWKKWLAGIRLPSESSK